MSTAELFAPANRRAVTIGTGLFFLRQMSGVNAIVCFSSAMFVAAGLNPQLRRQSPSARPTSPATILSGQALDRLGRKPLLTGSFIGMGISCLVMSYAMANQGTWALAGPVAVIAVMSYIASFGMGCGPIPGLLSSKSSTLYSRRRDVTGTTHWVFSFVIGQLSCRWSRLLAVPRCLSVSLASALFRSSSLRLRSLRRRGSRSMSSQKS